MISEQKTETIEGFGVSIPVDFIDSLEFWHLFIAVAVVLLLYAWIKYRR